jgi:hypothetical protein
MSKSAALGSGAPEDDWPELFEESFFEQPAINPADSATTASATAVLRSGMPAW